jgi:2'-5' RNA ligase
MAQLWLSMDISDNMVKQQLAYYQNILKHKMTGDWEDPNDFHVTVDFLGEDETDFEKVVEGMKLFEKQNKCFNQYVFASGVNRFPQGALWIGVNSSFKLYQARYQLEECFNRVGYQKAPSKFKGYTPHITMAYDASQNIPDINVHGIAIPFDNITLWNSFKVNGQYVDNVLFKIKLWR